MADPHGSVSVFGMVEGNYELFQVFRRTLITADEAFWQKLALELIGDI